MRVQRFKLHSALSLANSNHWSCMCKKFRLHSLLLLVNSNHQSPVCRRDKRLSSFCVHTKSPAHRKMGNSRIFSPNFLRPELACSHYEDCIECRNYAPSRKWCFYGNSLHFFVIPEQFVGLACLLSHAFLRFMWTRNTAKQYQTKNLSKVGTNWAQTTHETQRKAHIK